MGLAPGEAAELGAALEEWFDDRCDIYRLTDSDDPYGGSDSAEDVVSEGIACFLEPGAAHSQVQPLLAKLQGVQLFLVSLPRNTDVQVNDHLIVTTRNDLHMRVQAVLAPETLEFERQVVASTEGEHLA